MAATVSDPAIEELLAAAEPRESQPPPRRELVSEAVAGLLLLAAAVGLAALFGTTDAPSPGLLALLVVAYAIVGRARFNVGAGYTCPTGLLLIPMAFLVPPALLPLIEVAAGLLRRLPEVVARQTHPLRLVVVVPDAWHTIGLALVVGAAGSPEATLELWPLLVAALAAQMLFDVTSSVAREWAVLGIPPRLQLSVMGEVALVDVALAPIGFAVAIAAADSALAVLLVVPLAGLLSVFGRERDERIRKALELSHAYRGTALLMGDVMEADDAYTGGVHIRGVAVLALEVGAAMGVDARTRRELELGGLLHDVGKLRVPNAIINKPGPLTPEEWKIIERHPVDGQRMLERVGGPLAEVGPVVRAHHERIDGRGYPDGLAGEEIPLAARIICACDAYNAMTTDRSYRRAMTPEEAVAELRRCAGTQFDPAVVEAIAAIVDRAPATRPVDALALS